MIATGPLGDVEATIHIARIIANGDPALWSNILNNRDKQRWFGYIGKQLKNFTL